MRKYNFELYISKLKAYYWEKGILPTVDVMQELLGIKSRDSISRFFNKLIEEGYLEKESIKKYIPTQKLTSFPVYDRVSCGMASEIESTPTNFIDINKYIIGGNPNGIVLVEVKGNSMEDAGIFEGDIVSLDTNNKYPRIGDIVISSIDGDNEFTLKRYDKENGIPYLKYENNSIYGDKKVEANTISIVGVVKGLVRQF
ncbi:MAG: S24 family peptidase [Candidatus Gracilibacteria bacterium]|nr:S24 family peptidase [Candidatus Gracilibacteria bacterium]